MALCTWLVPSSWQGKESITLLQTQNAGRNPTSLRQRALCCHAILEKKELVSIVPRKRWEKREKLVNHLSDLIMT